jgi:hypothetical protein
MNLKLESMQGVLVATVAGRISLGTAIDAGKLVSDGAAERGLDCILLDGSRVEGELSLFERYEVGSTLAKYCVNRRRFHRVAVFGKENANGGFAALVAWNRGLTAEWFTERDSALKWLASSLTTWCLKLYSSREHLCVFRGSRLPFLTAQA